MPTHCLVAGASNLDRICHLDMPMAGGASVPAHIMEYPGGAGLNVSSGISALGTPVTFATILGNDAASVILRDAMETRGIEAHVQQIDGNCASYIALVQPDGELAAAVNDMSIYRHFDVATLERDLEGLSETDWLIVDANLEAETLRTLCKTKCRVAGLSVSVAKAPRLRGLAERLDLLFTNRREALALTGGNQRGSIRDAALALTKAGIRRAVISDGSRPVIVLNENTVYTIEVPIARDLRDVTGAGDMLAAGTISDLIADPALMAGPLWCKAVRKGIAAAQACIGVAGPWREDLKQASETMNIAQPEEFHLG